MDTRVPAKKTRKTMTPDELQQALRGCLSTRRTLQTELKKHAQCDFCVSQDVLSGAVSMLDREATRLRAELAAR